MLENFVAYQRRARGASQADNAAKIELIKAELAKR
jgi:hypothetical protein